MTTRARFRVGDLAVVELPAGVTEFRVVEDRGPLGVGGRRLVRVQVRETGLETPMLVEFPEELLLPATPEHAR